MTGDRLDVAQDTLDAFGLRYRTAGGGAFGIVVRSHWIVCEQYPAPKKLARSVLLTVARSCEIPYVVGESLEDAREELRGFNVEVRSLDGAPVVLESLWTVCEQEPEYGPPVQPVVLHVGHDCWDDD